MQQRGKYLIMHFLHSILCCVNYSVNFDFFKCSGNTLENLILLIQLMCTDMFACLSFEGTMSGGGNKVVKGRMGSSIVSDVNPDQLEQMEKTLEKETKTAEVWSQ